MQASQFCFSLLLLPLLISLPVQAELAPAVVLAGEIMLGNEQGFPVPVPKSDVSSRRNVRDRVPAVTSAADDEGILSPRGGAPADEREYQLRMREEARIRESARRQAMEDLPPAVGAAILLLPPMPGAAGAGNTPLPPSRAPTPMGNRERAGELRDKARAYGE